MGVQSISNSGLGRRNAKRSLEGVTGILFGAAARALFGGGYTGTASGVINYFQVETLSNPTTFGDLTIARYTAAAVGSETRAVFGGGHTSVLIDGIYYRDRIDYVTIATTGNATTFGGLWSPLQGHGSCSSSTRGVFAGGVSQSLGYVETTRMDYVTIATTGNSVNFGNLTQRRRSMSGAGSPTRGVFPGGYSHNDGGLYRNTIDYITIASTGNAVDFGDLTVARYAHLSSCSSNTRALTAGGYATSAASNVIDYITIATTGNSTDFGDLTETRSEAGAVSSQIRAVFAGGYNYSTNTETNTMDYVTIATTGNAVDFGDMPAATRQTPGISSNHGGIG